MDELIVFLFPSVVLLEQINLCRNFEKYFDSVWKGEIYKKS